MSSVHLEADLLLVAEALVDAGEAFLSEYSIRLCPAATVLLQGSVMGCSMLPAVPLRPNGMPRSTSAPARCALLHSLLHRHPDGRRIRLRDVSRAGHLAPGLQCNTYLPFCPRLWLRQLQSFPRISASDSITRLPWRLIAQRNFYHVQRWFAQP